jgi:DHA1 family bicyclomycin/chloramphenicol resistance-like MFS transporter
MRKRSLPEIRYGEFVSIVALMMAMAAMSIDIMLPALHDIGGALQVSDASDIQQVVTAFLVGFGSGQLFDGTVVPMTTAFAAFSSAALLAVWVTERGRFGGR